jgi:murein DD-endopeptidase MepM/ murein hydrolase activator NlpD
MHGKFGQERSRARAGRPRSRRAGRPRYSTGRWGRASVADLKALFPRWFPDSLPRWREGDGGAEAELDALLFGGGAADPLAPLVDRVIAGALAQAARGAAAPAAEASASPPTLKRGSRGSAVAELQRRLADAGYRLVADGIFGPITDAAVRDFQRSRRLIVDGVVGRMTWAALLDTGLDTGPAPGYPGTAPSRAPLIWPVIGTLTSPFGQRIHPITKQPQFHNGIDIAAPSGTPVRAAAAGRASAGYDDISGHYVYINHGDLSSSYSHLSGINVAQGQQVAQGDVIGWVGSTGRSTGPHLHFRVNDAGGTPIDPLGVLG